jgi:hypothetical protein
MADATLATPPLTSAQAVMDYLHPAPLEQIEIGPLYVQGSASDGKSDSSPDITHFARSSARAVAIDSRAYDELLKAKQQLKREKKDGIFTRRSEH